MANYTLKHTGEEIDSLLDKARSAYVKPNMGIPESDLNYNTRLKLQEFSAELQTAPEYDYATCSLNFQSTPSEIGSITFGYARILEFSQSNPSGRVTEYGLCVITRHSSSTFTLTYIGNRIYVANGISINNASKNIKMYLQTPTIADKSIGTTKIADNAVTTPKIANKAVTGEKIAEGTITADKLSKGVLGNSSSNPTVYIYLNEANEPVQVEAEFDKMNTDSIFACIIVDGNGDFLEVCYGVWLYTENAEEGLVYEFIVNTRKNAMYLSKAPDSEDIEYEVMLEYPQSDIEDIDQIREGATKGMTALQEYYDDGSGEVVPVKHPDLSTQPSILPYKFAGNYVYEQMVWMDEEKFSDRNIDEIDLIKFQDYGLDIKSAVLIDHHVFIVGHEYYSNYVPLPYDSNFCFNIASDDKRIFLKRNGPVTPTCKGVWIRVVWTSEPKRGGYYYDYNAPESKYNFHIKGFEGLSFSIDGEPIDDSVKLPDNLVERFISGTDIYIDTGGESIVMVECAETSESKDTTNSFLFAIKFRYYNEYNRILSIEYAFPIAAERIKKGEKVTLIFKRA